MKNVIAFLLCSICSVFLSSACGESSSTSTSDGSVAPDRDPGASDPGDQGGSSTSGPEDGGPLGGGPYPIGEVAFVITNPDGSTVEYSVSCLGDTATVFGSADTSNDTIGTITGDLMCRSLGDAAVMGRLVDGLPADRVCAQVFGSGHTAVVSGDLDGIEFSTTFHRADGCGIDDWDRLMIDLLPPV